MNCRFCGRQEILKFLDFGAMPLANAFLTADDLAAGGEQRYPLDLFFCERCGLVQIGFVVPPEALFGDYIYFSSTSDLVHRHGASLATSFKARFGLNEASRVVEIASNDGTILQYFKRAGARVLGVEPASNIARVAAEAGIETLNEFFHLETARAIRASHGAADVILARHVFAHVPEIHGFVEGLRHLLAPGGAIAIEAPYLLDFVEKTEFDTVYHEHYSYLSVRPMSALFRACGMEIFDAERVAIHGGSLIYYIGHAGAHRVDAAVNRLEDEEVAKGLHRPETYRAFAARTEGIRGRLLDLLRGLKASGKRVAAYGAPAKGNTLLNYCGISPALVEYTVDKSPHKQNLFTPGMHLPVHHPDTLARDMPDYVLLLAWNFADEILEQQRAYREKGGKFIVPFPDIRVVE